MRLGRCGFGFDLHVIHQALDAHVEAAIELGGFVQDQLAVIDGIQFLLTQPEDALLHVAERHHPFDAVFERIADGAERFER